VTVALQSSWKTISAALTFVDDDDNDDDSNFFPSYLLGVEFETNLLQSAVHHCDVAASWIANLLLDYETNILQSH